MDPVQQDKLQATKSWGHRANKRWSLLACSFSFLASVPLRLHATSAARCAGGLDARVCQGVVARTP